MAPLDKPKRMLVRTSLVAGSTVATLIGAQTLMTIDSQNPAFNGSSSSAETQIENTAVPQVAQATPTVAVVRALPNIQIVHVAPSISIVRQTVQSTVPDTQVAAQPTTVATAVPPTQVVIQPPAPVQIQPPAPVVIQQSSSQPAPRTQSSR